MKVYRISVRTLVEFILRQGDLGGGFSSVSRAQEGTRLHQKLQKQAGADYEKEVPFQESLQILPETELIVEGRADGIYRDEDGIWTVDEIKSTVTDPKELEEDSYPLHWAQARCYAYMLSRERGLEQVRVRLSYIYTETEEVRFFYREYTAAELEEFWQSLLDSYALWIRWQETWRQERNRTAEALAFPFRAYRPGQRTMAAYVYQGIREGRRLFLQAPTGIGKTMSALFPAIKALGQELGEKIFYLTAKNITAQAPAAALSRLRQEGLRCKSVVITAKDKICFQEKRRCTAEACPYAAGHFDRVNAAVYEALQAEDHFDKERVQDWARREKVCPFEFSLDLALWADVIICDYNYAFDPTAALKRFFQGKNQEYILLVDEAHNLVDRSREMFSAGLNREDFLEVRRLVDKEKEPGLYRSIDRVRRLFVELNRGLEEDFVLKQEPAPEWYRALQRFTERMEAFLQQQRGEAPEELLNLYFNVLFFLRIWDGRTDGYEFYIQRQGRDILLRFFCVNPAQLLQEAYDQVRSVAFFSATLTPIRYYKTLLGGREEDQAISLPSPFDPARQKVLIGLVDATYQGREASLGQSCDLIVRLFKGKEGHYLVFFPSFAYLAMAGELFASRYPEIPLLCQQSTMTEEEKKEFLDAFEKPEPVLGFAVLGGAFSEGIDLIGDRLIGAVILSVGLPQLGRERDLIRRHMEKETGQGFEYAYMYPGWGRVLQAAGRVIRTEADRGVILLLDQRFEQERYRRLYPDWWTPRAIREDQLEGILEEFWSAGPEEK